MATQPPRGITFASLNTPPGAPTKEKATYIGEPEELDPRRYHAASPGSGSVANHRDVPMVLHISAPAVGDPAPEVLLLRTCTTPPSPRPRGQISKYRKYQNITGPAAGGRGGRDERPGNRKGWRSRAVVQPARGEETGQPPCDGPIFSHMHAPAAFDPLPPGFFDCRFDPSPRARPNKIKSKCPGTGGSGSVVVSPRRPGGWNPCRLQGRADDLAPSAPPRCRPGAPKNDLYEFVGRPTPPGSRGQPGS